MPSSRIAMSERPMEGGRAADGRGQVRHRLLRTMCGVDVIEKRWMALLMTASVAHACVIKGVHYLELYPGYLGLVFFILCPFTAVIVGVNLLALTRDRGHGPKQSGDLSHSAPTDCDHPENHHRKAEQDRHGN